MSDRISTFKCSRGYASVVRVCMRCVPVATLQAGSASIQSYTLATAAVVAMLLFFFIHKVLQPVLILNNCRSIHSSCASRLFLLAWCCARARVTRGQGSNNLENKQRRQNECSNFPPQCLRRQISNTLVSFTRHRLGALYCMYHS